MRFCAYSRLEQLTLLACSHGAAGGAGACGRVPARDRLRHRAAGAAAGHAGNALSRSIKKQKKEEEEEEEEEQKKKKNKRGSGKKRTDAAAPFSRRNAAHSSWRGKIHWLCVQQQKHTNKLREEEEEEEEEEVDDEKEEEEEQLKKVI